MDIENMNIEKATERCNQLIKQEHANWIGISNQVAIIRVLNELEKKDSLINEQLKENVRLQNELNEENKRCMILANNDKFKEQVIDEMAKYINNFDIDEDICKKVDEPCKNYAGENGKLCNECIIDYFTKKVEGK